MQTIAAQLHAAMVLRGWSVARLVRESGVKLDRTSVSRKLRGKQPLFTGEASQFAKALDVTLIVSMRAEA